MMTTGEKQSEELEHIDLWRKVDIRCKPVLAICTLNENAISSYIPNLVREKRNTGPVVISGQIF